jgi:predicted secreted protein
MNIRKDAQVASSVRLHRRTLLGGSGALLASALLAACGESTGAQDTASSLLPPTASGGNTGAQGSASPTSITYPNGVTVSSSNGSLSAPLSSLVPATPAPPLPPVNGVKTITNADNGTTINLAAGTQVILALDEDHDWTVTVEDQTVLTLMVGAAAPSGAQGVYAASKPGQTTLTAVGEPPCRKTQPPCDAPTVLFRVGIAVASPAVGVPTVRTVTLADDRQTISLPTGTSFLLSLATIYDWQVQIADPAIVSPYVNAATPPDSQGIFTASHQGQTMLTAIGTPTCYTATPRCLAPSRQFTVQIIAT